MTFKFRRQVDSDKAMIHWTHTAAAAAVVGRARARVCMFSRANVNKLSEAFSLRKLLADSQLASGSLLSARRGT